jgi:hypothetical protein
MRPRLRPAYTGRIQILNCRTKSLDASGGGVLRGIFTPTRNAIGLNSPVVCDDRQEMAS